MKNLLYKISAITAVLILSGANAYAIDARLIADAKAPAGAAKVTVGTATLDNTIEINISKGVVLTYGSDGTHYEAGTLHTAGNRQFGTGDDSSTIWWTTCAKSPCGYNVTSSAGTKEAGAIWAPPALWTSL